jgi:HlyD family secretion protein
VDSVPASLITAQSDLATAQRNLEDAKTSSLARAQAQLALVNAQTAVTDAENTVASYKYKRGSSSTIDYYSSQVVLAQKQVDAAQSAYNQTSGLSDDDPKRAQAVTNLYNAKQSLTKAQGNLNWFTSQPSSSDVALAEANLAVAQAQFDEAQRKWDRLKDGPDPSDIAAAQAKVDAAQINVNNLYLIAPFDGEIIAIDTATGDLVNTGNAGIVLVDRNTLKVEAQVDETDIARVAVGNVASVAVDALPGITLNGKVVSINPIGATVSGLVKYTVNIALEPTEANVLFGATADVTLITSEPRNMLAVPLGAVQTDTQGEYVMRVNALGNTERVNVTSDSVQGEVVAISGDLKEGDRVLITATTTTTNNQGGPGGGFLVP